MPRWACFLAGAVALGATYAAIYKLVLIGSSFGASVGATFWPASGVTVSVLILRPRREWPLYLLAIGTADFLMDTHGGGYSAGVSLGIAVANCAEPLLAATLLGRWLRGRPDLSDMRSLGLFYLAAAGAGPLLSATIASLWQWLLTGDSLWPYLGRWYLGDALGVTVITPAILTFATRWSRPRRWQVAGLLGVVLVAGLTLTTPFAARAGLPFLVVPSLSLVAIRLGTRQAAAALFLVGITVEVLTVFGQGPFAGGSAFTGLVSAQMYMVACSASALTAAALMAGLVRRDRLALRDSLTGLANRRLLVDRASVSLDPLASRSRTPGLVFIDLDGFKAINDHHGHAVGDRVLIEVARRLQIVVRERDTIARIGGDEFVILVDGGDDTAAIPALVRRVERVVAQPIQCGEVSVQVGASIGYSIRNHDDKRLEDLLSRADDAMYRIKRTRADRSAVTVCM